MNTVQIAQNIKNTAKGKNITMTKLFNDLQINKSLIYQMKTRGSMPALDALNEHKNDNKRLSPGGSQAV